jgi:hypothetical protein
MNQVVVLIYILYHLTVRDYEKGAAKITFSGLLNTTETPETWLGGRVAAGETGLCATWVCNMG